MCVCVCGVAPADPVSQTEAGLYGVSPAVSLNPAQVLKYTEDKHTGTRSNQPEYRAPQEPSPPLTPLPALDLTA